MAIPKPTLHWIHLQQRTEGKMGLFQWRHNMCMRHGHRKHSSHATMHFLFTSLRLGWSSKVQWYRKGMCWTIEEKSLMTQWWLWLVLSYCNFGYHLLLRAFASTSAPRTEESFLHLWPWHIITWTMLDEHHQYHFEL